MELLNVLCEELRRHPEDEERWFVLADALMDLGEPRGELIALTSPEVSRIARRRHPELEWWRRLPEDLEVRIAALTDEASWTEVFGLPSGRGRRAIAWHRGTVQRVGFAGCRGVHVLRTLDALMGHWSGRTSSSLGLQGMSPSPRNARRILRHPGVRHARELMLEGRGSLFEEALSAEIDVRELVVVQDRGPCFDRVGALLEAPWVEQLTSLVLPCASGPAQVARLAACQRLRGLRWLDVWPYRGRPLTSLEPLYESPVLADCAIYPPPLRDRRGLPPRRRPYRQRR